MRPGLDAMRLILALQLDARALDVIHIADMDTIGADNFCIFLDMETLQHSSAILVK